MLGRRTVCPHCVHGWQHAKRRSDDGQRRAEIVPVACMDPLVERQPINQQGNCTDGERRGQHRFHWHDPGKREKEQRIAGYDDEQ